MPKDKSSITTVLLKKSTVVTIFTLLAVPFGYGIKMIHSRILSPEMFGLLYAIIAFISIFKPYQDLGFNFSLSYFVPPLNKRKDLNQIGQLFSHALVATFLISVVVAILLLVNAEWLANNYFKVAGSQILISIFCLFILSSSITTTFKNLFIGLEKETYYSSAQIIQLATTFILSAIAFLMGITNIVTYALIWVGGSLFVVFHYLFFVLSFHKTLLVRWHRDWKIFKKLSKFSFPYLSNQVIYFAINQTGLIFLTLFTNVTNVGVYSVILPIITIPSMFLSPLQNIFFPLIPQFMENEREKLRTLIENIFRILPFLTLYFNFFILLFPKYTIGIFFSNQWISAGATPLVVMSIGYIFSNVAGYLTKILDGMGLIAERMKMLAVIAVANLVIGAILIYFFEVTGLVLAESLVFILTVVLMAKLIKSRIEFALPWKFYIKYVTFLITIFILVKTLDITVNTWPVYIVFGIAYTLITVVFALTQEAFEPHQLKLLQNQVNKVSNFIRFKRI